MLKKYFYNLATLNNFSLSVFFLIPLALLSGRGAIPDILLSLFSVLYLIQLKNVKEINYELKVFTIVFIIFCFYSILRSIFSIDLKYSLFNSGEGFYFRYLIFLLAVQSLLNLNPKTIQALEYFFYSIILIIFIDSMLQIYSGKNIFGFEAHNIYRVSSFMGKEPKLGIYVMYIATFVYLFNLTENPNLLKKILVIVSPILFFFLLIVSGDRTSLIIFTFITFIYLLIQAQRLKFKMFFVILSSILISIVLTLFTFEFTKKRIIDRTYDQIKLGKLGYLPFPQAYSDLYTSAFIMGLDNILFGHGPGIFAKNCKLKKYIISEKSCSTHPHNFYLQIWAELGLTGIIFLLSFYIFLIHKLFNIVFKLKKNLLLEPKFHKFTFLNISLLIFLFPLFPNLNFYNNWNNIFIYLLIGFYFHYSKFIYSPLK